ncbi:MAG: UDP-N-acetylmuramate dehydrogenase [Ruminococcaceae bacterium]|nr:UDP-N-acetylmuramate dehydrogenase [Oscillospiraceae bacterium]
MPQSILHDHIKKELAALLGCPPLRLRFNEPMSDHTSFRIGGQADAYFEPASDTEILQALQYCQTQDIPCTVLGNGTNILVADAGIRGLVMVIGSHYAGVESRGYNLEVKAGTRLSSLAAAAAQMNGTGLEFASGIPGTLGGAIQMNAGAYDGCMQDVVVETVYLDEQLRYQQVTGQAHQFGYRHSVFSDRQCVILKAKIQLKSGVHETIIERMADLAERRRRSQPLELPSAGSVFKRPTAHYAGKLISDCQLKGLTVGGAQVSEKHAGFIVNLGQATASDVRKLIDRVQIIVAEQTDVVLEREIKFIGDWQS